MIKISKYGFTLIELMIVTVIISLIVAIAIPTIWATRMQAQIGGVKSTLRTISTAEQVYLTRFGSFGTYAELRDKGMLDSRFESDPLIENGYTTSLVVTNGGVGFLCTAIPENASAPTLSVDETGYITES
jgi:prepilin-type N-terminal cleavage/methylation domain-containing protein